MQVYKFYDSDRKLRKTRNMKMKANYHEYMNALNIYHRQRNRNHILSLRFYQFEDKEKLNGNSINGRGQPNFFFFLRWSILTFKDKIL